MRLLFTGLLFLSSLGTFAIEGESQLKNLTVVKKVFPKAKALNKINVADPIGEGPVNTVIFEVIDGEKTLGFARPIETTTGCNSACLPISYMAFYNTTAQYLKLISSVGLTKINHAPFTASDYAKLDFILALAPTELSNVKNPRDMTDALSGATLKTYQNLVVQGAAYSSLRIHLYNQLSIKQIKAKLLKARSL